MVRIKQNISQSTPVLTRSGSSLGKNLLGMLSPFIPVRDDKNANLNNSVGNDSNSSESSGSSVDPIRKKDCDQVENKDAKSLLENLSDSETESDDDSSGNESDTKGGFILDGYKHFLNS